MPRAKGERKLEILKALAQMLEAPRWERITTAALAAKLDVSEAALYRHFASKAQMYEGLIEFIENSVFTLANKITSDEGDGRQQADRLLEMLLAFAEKNPGMVRVMTGDALVDDMLENLRTAKRLGMATVWVSREPRKAPYVDWRVPSVTRLPGLVFRYSR